MWVLYQGASFFLPSIKPRTSNPLSCMMMQKHGCCGNRFLGEGERGNQCKICHHLICSSRRSGGKRERDFSCNGGWWIHQAAGATRMATAVRIDGQNWWGDLWVGVPCTQQTTFPQASFMVSVLSYIGMLLKRQEHAGDLMCVLSFFQFFHSCTRTSICSAQLWPPSM